MALPSLSPLFCTQEDVEDLLSVLGVSSRVDADGSATVDAAGREGQVITKALSWATARVRFYTSPRYRPEDISGNWMVNYWASCLAAQALCRFGGQPCPEEVANAVAEVLEDLKLVRAGTAHVPDSPTASVDWPAWSNVTVDPAYRTRQARVQRPTSERTPTQYPQAPDWRSEGLLEN